MRYAAALLALAMPALANEEMDARYKASDLRAGAEVELSTLPGVVSVGLGGSGTDYRLIVVVRDLAAKLGARERLGGDAYGGVKILWCVTAAPAESPRPAAAPVARPAPAAPLPPPPPVQTVAAPSWSAPAQPYVVETRRTFYAGPSTLTPARRSSYGYYSNCAPSRGYLAVGRCNPGYGGGYMARADTTCAPRVAPSCPSSTPAVCYRPGR
jgi:hypothetical protein